MKQALHFLKQNFLRVLALALCAVLLAVTVPVTLFRGSETQARVFTPEEAQGQRTGSPLDVWLNGMFDAFWGVFRFMDYVVSPRERLVYNDQTAFQHLFGYNELFDRYAFVANVYADTIRCKFRYEGKDWLVQLWKGAYAIFLATGGEIGVYTKPLNRAVEHYDGAEQADWLNMEMTIYNRGKAVFTRPFDTYWWCTGYGLSYLSGFYRKPRWDCVMEACLQFKDGEMAALFAAQLAAKQFVRVPLLDHLNTPECYQLDGDTVRLVWQRASEGWY